MPQIARYLRYPLVEVANLAGCSGQTVFIRSLSSADDMRQVKQDCLTHASGLSKVKTPDVQSALNVEL